MWTKLDLSQLVVIWVLLLSNNFFYLLNINLDIKNPFIFKFFSVHLKLFIPTFLCNTKLRPLEPSVTTHEDCKLASQTNTSLSNALWPHSCALEKTYQEVTHPKIASHQARLTVEFLANRLPRKEGAPCCYE